MNAKRKGNIGQAEFANFLQRNGFRAQSDGSRSGGGIFKGDIHNDHDVCYEVKTVKKINLQEAWAQVNRDASLCRSMPVLAIRFDGMPKGEWLMVLTSEDYIALLKGLETRETSLVDPKLKFKLNSLRNAAQEVIRALPEH